MSAGTIATATAVIAYTDWPSPREALYHGTTLRRDWRYCPIGIASRKPVKAGMAVSRLTSRFVPPSRTRKTGMKTPAALTTPIAADSRWTAA